MCEWVEEGRVRQGRTKRHGTQDGETEEDIQRKNKRWKHGWKDVNCDLENWLKAKTGSNLCQLRQTDSPITCCHVLLIFLTSHLYTHTIRPPVAEWMNAHGWKWLAVFVQMRFMCEMLNFVTEGAHSQLKTNWALALTAHFCYSADGKEVRCRKISCYSNALQ